MESRCCQGPVNDLDAFDGRSFCRARPVAFGLAPALNCIPCSGAVDVVDPNPDPQKHAFESKKGRWGSDQKDQFIVPEAGKRDVVARGMNRFEIGKVAPRQPEWEQLSPSVICVIGCNPSSFTLNGTCCYLVGTGKRRILIDTGETDFGHKKFLAALDACMKANEIEGLQEILITHMHHDHYGGLPGVLERYGENIPIRKLPNPHHFWTTLEIVRNRGLLPYLEHEDGTPRYEAKPGVVAVEIPPECVLPWPDEEAEAGKRLSWDVSGRTKLEFIRDFGFVKRSYWYAQQIENVWNFHPLSHGDVIETEGATLVAYHTPGHASDHCSFWLQDEKCLFSGDHVLGWGTTFMMDLYDYMTTLKFLIALRPVHLFPGHGPMIDDGLGLLERYLEHRQAREDQVEDVLLQNPKPLSTQDLVKTIYTDTPEHRLWMAAENVSKVLRKFDKAGVAKAFKGNEDGSMERFQFPETTALIRKLPEDLVWLHRFHFRAETRGGPPARL